MDKTQKKEINELCCLEDLATEDEEIKSCFVICKNGKYKPVPIENVRIVRKIFVEK